MWNDSLRCSLSPCPSSATAELRPGGRGERPSGRARRREFDGRGANGTLGGAAEEGLRLAGFGAGPAAEHDGGQVAAKRDGEFQRVLERARGPCLCATS
jgi:hypothetical protein